MNQILLVDNAIRSYATLVLELAGMDFEADIIHLGSTTKLGAAISRFPESPPYMSIGRDALHEFAAAVADPANGVRRIERGCQLARSFALAAIDWARETRNRHFGAAARRAIRALPKPRKGSRGHGLGVSGAST